MMPALKNVLLPWRLYTKGVFGIALVQRPDGSDKHLYIYTYLCLNVLHLTYM